MKIIKIGGNIINDKSTLTNFLDLFSQIKEPKILVHGGGKKATELASKLGIESEMFEGRRITDEKTLEIVTMVYAGLINKTIVAQLSSLGCNAIGLTGADMNLIQAHKRIISTVDYGYVGDIDKIDANKIKTLLKLGITPVFCAITHNNKNQLLNTNADTIASELSKAMSAYYKVELLMVFEKKGVLKNPLDDQSVISIINKKLYEKYLKKGIISGGMIPKINNAFEAINNGVYKVTIGSVSIITDSQKGSSIQ